MPENENEKIVFAEFTFDKKGNLLFSREKVVPLEPVAARVLRYFLENNDRIIAKNELLDAVWTDVFTTEDVLKRAVSQIRRALGDDAKNSRFIETHHRRGYRFIVPQTNFQNGGEKNENNFSPQKSEERQKLISTETIETDDPNFDCFVGRSAAMEFLQTEFRRVLRGAGQPVLIVGDPGIGKTQTAAHFVEWTQAASENGNRAVSLRVRFFDYEASFIPPYDVFLDLLNEACAAVFGSGESGRHELRQKIETNLKIVLPDELFSSQIAAPHIFADASRAIAPLAESFARLARIRPLVLIFDDVQWADETSRKIIGYLMRIAADAPLMFVGLARKTDAENAKSAIAEWMRRQAVYRSFTTLELLPLSLEDCREIIAEIFCGLLDADAIPNGDLLKLHRATSGNPYFLIETLRLLMNENVIEKSVSENNSRWHWRGIEDVPLPETVRMAARAKLSKLSDAARELVECAAILGDAFQIETLDLMISGEGEKSSDAIENCLDEAIEEQVLTERNVSGADDCQFYHTTLRRAVYMDLSPRRRRRLHSRAMRAIEISRSGEIEKFAAALAAHAENAGEFGASLQLNLQACRSAIARFDWLEASEVLNRGERVAAKISADKISKAESLEFLALRGEVYMSIGRRIEAEKILSEAAALAEKEAGENDSAEILLNLGRTGILLGKYREAIPVLEKSLSAAKSSGNNFNISAALIQIASAKYALCEYEESSAILQKIIDEEDEQSYNRAVALGKLGWLRSLQSHYAAGKILLEQALEFHRTAGDLRERAVLAMCLNACEYGLGNYEAAIEYARQARREAQIVGEPYNESVAMMRVAKSRIAQGLYTEAENLLNEVWEKQKNLDAPHAQAETIWLRGRVHLEKGDLAKAENDLQTALEMIRSVGDRDDEFRFLITQSALRNALGNFTDALRLAENAEKIAKEIGVSEGIGEALTAQSRILLKLEKTDEAIRTAREAVGILEEFDSGEIWRAFHALAAALLAAQSKDFAEIEFILRRAVSILAALRGQFPDTEELHYVQLTKSLNTPARVLRDFLGSQNRTAEADEISRAWLID